MNILFVNDIPFNPIGGGIERVTDILSKELIKRGHTIYYLCEKLPQSQLYLLNYEFPAKLYQLPRLGFLDNEENILFYKNILKTLAIDVVVNQRGFRGRFNSLLQYTDTKTVSVIHSSPNCDVTIFCNKIIESTAPPFVEFKKFIKRIFRTIISLYWKRKVTNWIKIRYNVLANYSNAVITLSQKDNDIFEHLIDTSIQTKIVSIPNPNTFTVTKSVFEPKQKIILYVSRLTKDDKEPLRLLKIWKYLHLNYPEWKLIILGEGEEKDKMQDYVKEQCLNNVFFEGRQSDVAQYYKKASFVCLTSNYEGWGMCLTEGMQYGCIPFTFNNYGAAFEIIDDGINGCLIPAFNLKKYANRLSDLMSDENKRIGMSNAAVKKVELFSTENVVNKWETLFRNL